MGTHEVPEAKRSGSGCKCCELRSGEAIPPVGNEIALHSSTLLRSAHAVPPKRRRAGRDVRNDD
jgi:hypothetical protein